MSNLLRVVKMQSQVLQRKSVIPVMLEIPVNPDCAPFLVSGSKKMVWIDGSHPGDVVKVAPRRNTVLGVLFMEIIEAVATRGQEEEWGNVHPFSARGVASAVEHVQSYDLLDLEILVPRVRDEEHAGGAFQRPPWLTAEEFSLPIRPSGWLPEDCALVVPRDREFVGMVGHISPKVAVVVVHNPSRGIAIARGDR